MTGILYFVVIVMANTIGSVSGMGGGVIIKPVFDLIAAHSVVAISFYSTVAVFVMAVVSTWRQIQNGMQVAWKIVAWISCGAFFGGRFGNAVFAELVRLFSERTVQLVQMTLLLLVLLFAFLHTRFEMKNFQLHQIIWYVICGLILGFLTSLLGIGGGPINVALLMLMFALPIKDATVYSLCTILFSQLSKLLTIAVTTGFARYDLTLLYFVIPAAVIGGLLGAKASRLFSAGRVTLIFQTVTLAVLFINIYNMLRLFW